MSSAHYAPTNTPATGGDSDGTGFYEVVSILLGLLVAVLGLFALMMWADARNAKDAANRAAAKVGQGGGVVAGAGLESYAGAAPTNADALAKAHKPFPATLPAIPAGPVANVNLVLKDITVEIAPGVKYSAWAWANGAPGPVIHVRQGQLVKITLTNKGAIPHSIDFHAARIAPDKAFGDVMPNESFSYTFRANDPGVFMYHCGTKPVLMHIANGMYGAIVVEPKPGVLPKADKNYILVASEWYLDSDGLTTPATYNVDKAHARQPDWMTFNGYSGQYVAHPLTAKPGELVRFWVVDAGPSLDTDFHIVGTILNTAYPFADMNPAEALHNVQTVTVPAGGGGVFDVKIDEPGLYPFVSHAFAAVDQGQVGLLKVGKVSGTASH
ncbi:MAG: multicopper oxidase domain-containing protein [Actinomycetota bacterium]|nr:multicopper oxidase domain-containing protein [Actinomycetota bacterium]MDQ2982139.1 multicopper oxidase domain-containing protein [Actinomycetota bacterium]